MNRRYTWFGNSGDEEIVPSHINPKSSSRLNKEEMPLGSLGISEKLKHAGTRYNSRPTIRNNALLGVHS
jgi:hypothetical protein